MTRERAWEQAEIEFKQDGKRRFVHRRIAWPFPNYLITKWYTARRKWYKVGQFDENGKKDSEA